MDEIVTTIYKDISPSTSTGDLNLPTDRLAIFASCQMILHITQDLS